jgi:hypothetical protein
MAAAEQLADEIGKMFWAMREKLWTLTTDH